MSLGNPDRPVGGLAVRRPEGVELRPLGRSDLEAIGRLGFSPGQAVLDALVNDPDAAPFVATIGAEVVGLVGFRFRRRLNHATFEGWISDLFVRPDARGRGIGRMLAAATVAEWRLRGGHQAEVELRRDQVAAAALFEAAGFVERGKYFEIAPVATRSLDADPALVLRLAADDDADFDAATRLLAELGRPAPSDERMAAVRRTYRAHVERADTGSMIALLDGQRVGFISLEFRHRLTDGAPEAWIPDLIVTEAARGRRVGAALLDAAFAAALGRGCVAAKLESGSQRLVAHRLYHAAGMNDVGSYHILPR